MRYELPGQENVDLAFGAGGEVQPLDKKRNPCKFGRWWNVAIPEEAPDLVFRCSATGGEWKPGTKGAK